ncbi:hypothetical protein HYH02_005729 [Chlamydomonas schloesseri]|uniref:20S-pre-rRNA D-site endonuclease NOB1 n=1 Tax=Chlamydomonas schloesseri TaxID=2026947 RepID=A0A835WK86_9CHLO|nr:hypothetical protein HYH02_005729 [Chlamydomonas schloesseri]|eukprot:KAG2448975.1 hypothetical protein HYH02_005729 [Chlamydomonas schloesseri]
MSNWAAVAGRASAAPAPVEAPAPTAEERVAVVDTNAIISGLRLENLADRFCTIPEVLTEVRDKQARTFLSTLPFTIDVREPDEESLKAVQRFARETGDIHSLSTVDVKLLALAHSLEVAANGQANLRGHPVQVRTRQKHKSRPRQLPGWGTVPNPEDWKVVDEAPEDVLTNATGPGQSRIIAAVQSLTLDGATEAAPPSALPPPPPTAVSTVAPAAGSFGAAAAAAAAAGAAAALVPPPAQASTGQEEHPQAQASGAPQPPAQAMTSASGQGHGEDGEDDDQDDDEEEEDDGWCTAAKSRNAARRKARKERRHAAWMEAQQQQQQKAAQPSQQGTGTAAAAAPAPAAAADAAEAEAGQEDEEEEEDEEVEMEEHEGVELVTDDGEDDEGEDGDEGEEGAPSEAGTAATTAATTTTAAAGGLEVVDELLPNTTSNVFTVTADFAMQNVMLQMGLRLVTRDGKQITRVSRWALRCSACYFVTKEAGRLFCPRCGNMTMDKVEVTVGPGGAEFFGVRKKFILRGTRYSLPKPKGGRQAVRNPILREDVLLARQAGNRRGGAKPVVAGELDPFAPEYGTETWHQAGGGRGGGKGLPRQLQLTSWKNNPNEVKAQRKSRRK